MAQFAPGPAATQRNSRRASPKFRPAMKAVAFCPARPHGCGATEGSAGAMKTKVWHLAHGRSLELGAAARLMGILNVTPDSFSDGGRYLSADAALARALRMRDDGAAIVDVGGESTRPGAAEVDEAEELRRVLPVVERLATELSVPVSIDTCKTGVACQALDAGAAVVNDIAAGRDDPRLWDALRRSGAGYVAMHMQGTPRTMQAAPQYENVRSEIRTFFERRLACLEAVGVRREQVVLDPGIGFGKSLEHNLDLIAHLDTLASGLRPLLLGVSRKSFLGQALGVDLSDRLPGGLACTVWAALQGVQVFRTHDVAATVQALRMVEALSSVRSRSA